jgi:predicted dehydrogenase
MYQRMRELVATGHLGVSKLAEARILYHFPDEDHQSFRLHPELGGGGVLMDVGVHLIDLFRFIFNREIEEVLALSDNDPFTYPSDNTSILALRIQGNILATICVSSGIPHTYEDNLELYGLSGSIFGISGSGSQHCGKVIAIDDRGITEEPILPIDIYQNMIQDFFNSMTAGHVGGPNGLDGRAAQAVIMAAYKSIDRQYKKI